MVSTRPTSRRNSALVESAPLRATASSAGWPIAMIACRARTIRRAPPGSSKASSTACSPSPSPFRETGLMLPSSLPAERTVELVEAARGAAEAVGATDGPLHIEVMMTPGGPCVIEVNGRVGGSIPYIFDAVGDVNLFREAARIALGIRPETEPSFDGVGGMFNIHAPGEGRVTRLAGIDEARELPGVRQMMVAVHEGDSVSSLLGLLGGMIRVICAAGSADELFEIRDRVMDTVVYEVEPAS